MGFKYDPSKNNERQPTQAGRYWFRVEQAQEKVYQSGNEGLNLKLSVAVSAERNVPVFHNLMYMDSCLFKWKELCDAVGLDFNSPPINGWSPTDFEGKSGWGHFSPQGEKKYLGVDKLEPASANNGPDSKRGNDDVPF